jgi:hypothetical protein
MNHSLATTALLLLTLVTSACSSPATKELPSACTTASSRWHQLPGLAAPGDAHLEAMYFDGLAGYRRILSGNLPRWDDHFKHILHDNVYGKDTIIIPGRFAEASGFSESIAAFREGAHWGLIDTLGVVQVAPTFDHIGELPANLDNESFREGLAPARQNGLWGYIDRRGKWVIPASFYAARKFHEGLAFVKRTPDDRWGIINCQGDWVAQTDFEDVKPFFEGFAAVMTTSQGWGYCDRAGVLLKLQGEDRPGAFDEAYAFSEGYAAVKIGADAWGHLAPSGQIRRYQDVTFAQGYACGLAAVEIKGKWGYLDKQGKMAIQAQYLRANGFRELSGLGPCARVATEDGIHYIRPDGSTIVTGLE